jgi:AraC-like DNA-binding protein
MHSVVANRKDFFIQGGCPVAIRSIHGDAVKQHDGDLTDIRHTHDFAELITITQGSGKHWINGDLYDVTMGDVFLIHGRTEHYFTERNDLEMYNIMFDYDFLHEHLKNLHSMPGFNAFSLFEPTYRRRHRFQSRLRLGPAKLQQFEAIFRRMEREVKDEQVGFDLVLLSCVLEIFVLISREYALDHNPQVRSLFRLGNLVTRLENESDQQWTIARICRIAGMAPSTLLPTFKEVTGYSPIAYLLKVRLGKAAEALQNTDDAVSEIAEYTGFSDSNYFSRQFRKRYNASPRSYREKYRKNQL